MLFNAQSTEKVIIRATEEEERKSSEKDEINVPMALSVFRDG